MVTVVEYTLYKAFHDFLMYECNFLKTSSLNEAIVVKFLRLNWGGLLDVVLRRYKAATYLPQRAMKD